jgi:hemerythrin
MPHIDLTTIPQVATAFQNDDHRVEAELLNSCIDALDTEDDALPTLLGQLALHTREHFAREDQAMQRTGFPPFAVHHQEHQRVLAELAAVVQRFGADHDRAALRLYLARDVAAWFVSHIQTMDFITARWVSAHEAAPAA